MSEFGHLFTCEICGEGQMSETAMQTHMYIAHVYSEIACMFCDLRGVSAEEMTLHINCVHCPDNSNDENTSHNGLQHHVNSVQQDADNPSTNQAQRTQLYVQSASMSVHYDQQAFLHSVGSNRENDRTGLSDASIVPFAQNCNVDTGSQHSHDFPGNMCTTNRDKQQKRKLSGMLSASSSCSVPDKTYSSPICVSGAQDASHCGSPLSKCSASTSKTIVANGMDRTFQGDRFVKYNC